MRGLFVLLIAAIIALMAVGDDSTTVITAEFTQTSTATTFVPSFESTRTSLITSVVTVTASHSSSTRTSVQTSGVVATLPTTSMATDLLSSSSSDILSTSPVSSSSPSTSLNQTPSSSLTSPSASATTTAGTAPGVQASNMPNSNNHDRTIVAIVVPVVVAFFLLAGLGLWYWVRQLRSRYPPAVADKNIISRPWTDPKAQELISHNIGTTLIPLGIISSTSRPAELPDMPPPIPERSRLRLVSPQLSQAGPVPQRTIVPDAHGWFTAPAASSEYLGDDSTEVDFPEGNGTYHNGTRQLYLEKARELNPPMHTPTSDSLRAEQGGGPNRLDTDASETLRQLRGNDQSPDSPISDSHYAGKGLGGAGTPYDKKTVSIICNRQDTLDTLLGSGRSSAPYPAGQRVENTGLKSDDWTSIVPSTYLESGIIQERLKAEFM